MAKQAKLKLRGGAVRLTLPAQLANDLGALQGSLRDLAERLGHPACATGCDTLFMQVEREFVAAGPGNLSAITGNPFLPQDPVPDRSVVNVSVPEKVSGDIEALQKAVAVTVGKLGCRACCSGFDIAFRRELDLIALDETLGVQGFGRFR